MNPTFLGKILQRVDHLEPHEVQSTLLRLARENDFLETILCSLKEGVVVLDEKGCIEYINPAAHELLPFPDPLPENSLIHRYLKDVDWEALLEPGQASNRVVEITYPAARYLELNVLPVESGQNAGPRAGFVAIFHDITRRTSEAREILESERVHLMTLLAAGVAHELGNPINNLNIHLQLMEREARAVSEPQSQRMLEGISVAKEEIKRMDTIIHEFLRAVRPTKPDFHPVRLPELLEETQSLLQKQFDERQILIESDYEPDLPPIRADGGQLKQAFYNVLTNALQALPERGLVSIKIFIEGEWLVLEISDNGEGIEIEDISKVMQPYFTTKKRGTGLGLMIVQRIVGEHGGKLEMESERGKGTTVRILLPWRSKQVCLLE
jgi:two-component system, sporulation sensor kinase E